MASDLGGFVFTAGWGLITLSNLKELVTVWDCVWEPWASSLPQALRWPPLQVYLEAETFVVVDEGWATSQFTDSGLSDFPMSPALSSENPEVALTLHFCYLPWIFWVMIFLQPNGIQLLSQGNQRHHGFSLCLGLLLAVGVSNSEWVILRKGPLAPSAILITTTVVGIFSPFSRSEDWVLWETLSNDTITIYCFNLLKD